MFISKEERARLEARGAEIRKAVLQENRQPTPAEETELRQIETAIDRHDFDQQHGDAQRRFTATVETRSAERPVFIPAETRMADVYRGSFQPEFAELTTADFLRQFIDGSGSAIAKRAMAEGTVGAGGALVPVQQSLNVVDILRNTSVVFRAGALTYPMNSSKMTMPRLATDPTAAVTAENTTITASDGVLEQITFTPFKIAALVKVGRELIQDSSPSASALIENALAAVLALKLDALCLYGAGTTEPKGIYTYANTVVPEVLAGANGLLPTNFDPFSQALYTVSGNNAIPTVGITNPGVMGVLDRLKQATTNAYMAPPESWGTIRKLVSNQVLANSTVGTSGAVCSTFFCGDFTGVAVGMRQQIQIQTSDVAGTAFADDQIWLKATLRGDMQLLQPKKLCVCRGIKTA
jgi:HK97 family phage major capsid protein